MLVGEKVSQENLVFLPQKICFKKLSKTIILNNFKFYFWEIN